jgi:cytochrome c peroxidase
VSCHNGPLLTDHHAQNTGVPAAPGMAQDLGRAAGAPPGARGRVQLPRPLERRRARGLRRTPLHGTLGPGGGEGLQDAVPARRRNPPALHARRPDRHADQVLAHYATAPAAPEGHGELPPRDLSDTKRAQLTAFLQSLAP